MATIPLPALGIQQQPSVLDQAGKFVQLKSLLGQQALQPGQLQEQQQQIQGAKEQNQLGALDVQQKQIQLNDQQILSKLYPQFGARATTPSASGAAPGASAPGGYDWEGLTKAAIDSGVSMNGLNQIIGIRKQSADLTKTLADSGTAVIAQQQKSNDALNDAVESLQAIQDPQARAQALPGVISNLQKMGVDTSKLAQQQPTDDNLAALQTTLGVHQQVIDEATKLANLNKTKGEASEIALKTAPITGDQLQAFTKTVGALGNLNPSLKASYAQQGSQARTYPELQAITENATKADQAEQLHADSLAQTKALVGNKFAETGLTANEKIWTDPMHGYQQLQSAANLTKQAIQQGASGSGLATSLAPAMVALGINSFNQTHRIAPAEAQAVGMPGGYAERFNAWLDKAGTGKLSPQVASEGNQLMDDLVNNAYSRSVQSSQLISKGHNIPPEQTPAMDKQGNVTTLDQVAGTQPAAAKSASGGKANDFGPALGRPDGATGTLNGQKVIVRNGRIVKAP